VLGLSRSEEPHSVFSAYSNNPACADYFQFVQADINKNLNTVVSSLKSFCPQYVVNFAAQGMVAESWKNPEHWYQTNVVGQVRLHDQLRRLGFLEKYVHVTTPEVYGSTNGWIKESSKFAPSTPYAVSRAACDLHLMSFFEAYDFPVVFTRAANVYGPGQQLYRIIPRALLCARTGRILQLHGGGHSVRCFVHIRDVAEATYRVAVQGSPGEAYHISTREQISIHDLVRRISCLTAVSFDDLAKVSEDRLGKDQAYLLDSTKIREELGWSDTIDLGNGLVQTLEWVDANTETLTLQPQEYLHKP
jgi:dTDP-glucose 4,6-dehydratase